MTSGRATCSRIVPNLELPDPDDRHVLAAAICAGAQFIVTFNLRDFSADTLAGFGIEAVHPDTFLEQQFESNEGLMVRTTLQRKMLYYTLKHS